MHNITKAWLSTAKAPPDTVMAIKNINTVIEPHCITIIICENKSWYTSEADFYCRDKTAYLEKTVWLCPLALQSDNLLDPLWHA